MTILSILPFALPLLTGGDHAALHPADATVYLCLPDVPAARRAYREAAVVKLLRDPEWNRFAARQNDADPETFRLDERACALLEERLLVPLLGERARDHAAVTGGLRSLSLSFSAPGASEADASEVDSPNTDARNADAEGVAWLPSLGAVLVLEHEDVQGARAAVALVTEALGLEAQEPRPDQRTLTLFDQEGLVQHWRAPADAARPAAWSAVCGRSAVVGLGATTPERWIALARDPTQRLSANERFVRGDTAATTTKTSTAPSTESAADPAALYDLWVDARDLARLAREFDANDAADTLASSGAAGLVSGLSVAMELLPADALSGRWKGWIAADGAFRCTSHTDLGALLPGIGARPVPREALERLPTGAMYSWAAGADFLALEGRIVDGLAAVLGIDADGARTFLAEDAGVDLRTGLLEPLGDHAFAFVHPFSGPALPECGLVLDLDDADTFVESMDAIARAVEERGDDVDLLVRPYRRQPTYAFFDPRSLTQLLDGDPGVASRVLDAFRPGLAVAVLDDRVVLSIDRRYLTREVRRVLDLQRERERDDEETGANPAGEALPTRNALAAADRFPETATSVSHTDWPVALGSLYDTVRTLLELLGGAFGGSGPEGLPETEALVRHFRPAFAWSRTVGAGTLRRAESPFGPELALGLALLALELAPPTRSSSVPAPVTAPAEPIEPKPTGGEAGELPAPGDESPDEVTALAAGRLVRAIHEHRVAAGAYPERLDALPEAAPTDGWGRRFHYELARDGADYRLWSPGPNGVDEDGRGDDRVYR